VDLTQITARKASRYFTAMGSRSHGGEETGAWHNRFGIGQFISVGSSPKFCLETDSYPRLGRTVEWDMAAGVTVLRTAGCIVLDRGGDPLIYSKRGRRSISVSQTDTLSALKQNCRRRKNRVPRLAPVTRLRHEYVTDEGTSRSAAS
jgi:3'-phosphoadenosine 5'-phosphosulfate (PAPS) 3'-phosphatase